MHSVLGNIKHVRKGETIGYELLYTAPKDLVMGTIPAGYYEGIDKRLTNKGSVLVCNTLCPIVGRVSMNITSIDISAVENPALCDSVTIISADTTAQNSVAHTARLCETSPYEILIHIPESLRRVVVE
jgi:alanine racemase